MSPLLDAKRYPLLAPLAARAAWKDAFPTSPEWAAEAERWLALADRHGHLERFAARLLARDHERDEAFAELAVAHFLEERNGLRLVEWEPVGAGGTKGEFVVSGPSGWRMFVEVTSPGWEREAVERERAAGRDPKVRLAQGKFVDGEAAWTTPWRGLRDAVKKKSVKFPPGAPNLLMIYDDQAVELNEHPDQGKIALYAPSVRGYVAAAVRKPELLANNYFAEDGCFVNTRYPIVGGVGVLDVRLLAGAERPDYRFNLYLNPHCDQAVTIPIDAFPGAVRQVGL